MSDLLQLVVSEGASDLHLRVGVPPVIRVHGILHRVEGPVCGPEDTEELMRSITSEDHIQHVRERGGADFGFAFGEAARFRVSVFKEKGNFGMVLRQIPTKLLRLEDIGLPPSVRELLYKPRGLCLVTGPTGSGKSTTLASMINIINEERDEAHIITIEDPIEFYHKHKKAIVTQREIGVDVPSFAEALRRALRQDPDIILVGEMRDLETIDAAVTAAETGHLVFGTLHTTGAAKTIDRLVNAFPTNQQEQIRIQLSTVLQAVISQLLIPRIDKPGRVAVFEIMINTPSVAALIRDNKTFRLNSDIQTGAKYGMVTLDSFLIDKYLAGMIAREEVVTKAQDPQTIQAKLQELELAGCGRQSLGRRRDHAGMDAALAAAVPSIRDPSENHGRRPLRAARDQGRARAVDMSLVGQRGAALDEAWGGYAAGPGAYFALLKPRVMSLVVVTALAGMLCAPGALNPVIGFASLLAIAVGAGAAGALNMWWDADIDVLMARTRSRPVPAGLIAANDALAFGLTLSLLSVLTLALAANLLAASLLAFTIFYYVVIYSMWLKRRTPMNIVIGGAAGALPPMIGYAAAGGGVTLDSLLLFTIIFMWTPPHFWALSLVKMRDYERAGVPMLPNVRGAAYTRLQILIYTLILAPLATIPYFTGLGGLGYWLVAVCGGGVLIAMAVRIVRVADGPRAGKAAMRLFGFSILYLFGLFAALLIEHGFGLIGRFGL